MKIIVAFLVGLAFFSFAGENAHAQKRKVTIILVRHAEKDASDPGSNPSLSPEGRRRAERFARLIKKYKPKRIYSTDYARTRQTAAPLAELRKLTVETYDARRQNELAALMASFRKGRRVVVVGHSNTIPPLANLLVGENKYENLSDSEYGKIWIIRLKKGKVRAEVLEY